MLWTMRDCYHSKYVPWWGHAYHSEAMYRVYTVGMYHGESVFHDEAVYHTIRPYSMMRLCTTVKLYNMDYVYLGVTMYNYDVVCIPW